MKKFIKLAGSCCIAVSFTASAGISLHRTGKVEAIIHDSDSTKFYHVRRDCRGVAGSTNEYAVVSYMVSASPSLRSRLVVPVQKDVKVGDRVQVNLKNCDTAKLVQ